ncbi:MAG TPA: type VI secretion system tip protein TssI/VgrG [Caulobacteraceae bacterium]|nr:type VI secretion system tip protein TssI/VgrG [Caulobacteraceae bacterium]
MDSLEDFEFDQTARIISVESFSLGPKKLCVLSLEGTEELSALSRFRLEVASLGRALKPSEVLGQKIGVAIRFRKEVRKLNGIVSRFEVLRTAVRRHYLHLFEVVPPAWLLTVNQKFKIFAENKASHEVIDQVLGAAGLSYELKQVGDQREYWVQYGESDYNLVARLLEDEGLFYRFDHSTPDCKLIVGDGKGDYLEAPKPLMQFDDLLESWQPEYRIGPSKFKHGAWDFKTVSSMDGDANGLPKAQPPGLPDRPVFEYPGRHEATGEGGRLATARMAEHEAQMVWVAATSTSPSVEAGTKFKVVDHTIDLPQSGQTSDTYVVVRVDHRARDASGMPFDGDRGYDNSFSCIPADFDYRPPRVTARPHIQGPQTGVVTDGPDEFGRSKVKFPWEGEGVSRWCRVAQVWAYNKMGSQFLPRIDSEVVVVFEHGDPDHPIIVGQVYNGNNKLPFDVPGNKTQSGIRGANWGSDGVPDTSNELRFEDKAGAEEIYIHAQKDMRRVIVNDDNLKVEQGNRTLEISMGNVSETVKMGNHDLKVNMGESSVDAMQSITLTVGQSSVKLDQMGVTIKGMMISIEGQISVDVKGLMTTVKGDAMLTLKGGITMIN